MRGFKNMRRSEPYLPSWWLSWVLNHSAGFLTVMVLVTALVVFFTVTNFKINADLADLVADDLPFRQITKAYHAEFPELVNPLVVVIEGDIAEQVREVRQQLGRRLEQHPDTFTSVYMPGGGEFFDTNGLLYLSVEELEEYGDVIAGIQPFLAMLADDISLPRLFSVLTSIVENEDAQMAGSGELTRLLNTLRVSFDAARAGRIEPVSWQNLIRDNDTARGTFTQLIIVQAAAGTGTANPYKREISLIRSLAADLEIPQYFEVTIGITGNPAINYEDLRSVRVDIGFASALSLLLVGITLYCGLGSLRLVTISLATLAIGLAWSVGFAILLVGRLNMISVTFIVLFIGLGIDYAIQITLRYLEFLDAGHTRTDAIKSAVTRTGNALIICSISTAIGFYAFVPTDYVGASELGLISGTAMLIILFISVSVLPALLNLFAPRNSKAAPVRIGAFLPSLLRRYSRVILSGAVIMGVWSALLLPHFTFDTNPLNLSDPKSEAVRTAMRLFADNRNSLWTISVVTDSREHAQKLAGKLEELPVVDLALTLDDFIPADQDIKLDQIEDIALSLPEFSDDISAQSRNVPDETRAALEKLSEVLIAMTVDDNGDTSMQSAAHLLAESIDGFLDPPAGRQDYARLNEALIPNLRVLTQMLHQQMAADQIGTDQLPQNLYRQYVSANGRYRIQVFPKDDLRDPAALRQFVTALQDVAPRATGQPVNILGSADTIYTAFTSALLTAIVLIALFLLAVTRRPLEVVLVLAPLILGIGYAMAATVLLNIPLNFANIIAIPLLLGIGVDFSLHVLHRLKEEGGDGNSGRSPFGVLTTSTARGILFSGLTTVMSFGSLSFIGHAGTASMGKLLTISVVTMIFCTLIVLPAFLDQFERLFDRLRSPAATNH
jgi:hopanoid biosynthesis associated RND transporter like protein HpnN